LVAGYRPSGPGHVLPQGDRGSLSQSNASTRRARQLLATGAHLCWDAVGLRPPVPLTHGVSMKMRHTPVLALTLTVVLQGCTVGPDYHRPAVAGADAGWTKAAAASDTT